MTIYDKTSQDIAAAMKAKDKVRLETLRNVKKLFIEAKTAPGANDTLPDDEAIRIMAKMVKQGKDAADIFARQGRSDLAEAEMEQVRIIEEYLPRPMTAEEVESALRGIIARTGAAGMKDMGKVMGVASKELAGRTDGKTMSALVKQLLA